MRRTGDEVRVSYAGEQRIGHVEALDLLAEGRQSFADGVDGLARQRAGKIAQPDARRIRRHHAAQFGRRLVGDEVTHLLRRRLGGFATQGEDVGVVIPNLLDYRDSMVVLDIKQENFDLTSGWRASIGQEVFLSHAPLEPAALRVGRSRIPRIGPDEHRRDALSRRRRLPQTHARPPLPAFERRRHRPERGQDVTVGQAVEKRALMLPQELKAIGTDKQIFFFEGIPHPVMCDKIRYYADKHYTRRLLPKVEVRPLKVH